ncbi:tetraspanin-18-like [Rhineura floridana]|uniref:tetraspanin-18-like n=1 Tax=Rhineura floridana TaxID=261503 RepID=UPI002AC82AA3|nr:tetraspanin-18-like [Rhineura floridana]
MEVLSLIKHLMFMFNGLVFLGGICLLGVGIWLIVDPEGVPSLISNNYLTAGCYLIAIVGAALTVLGYLGCYGAISENKDILILFFLLIFLVFALEIAAGLLIHFHGKEVQDEFFLVQLKENYKGDNSTELFTRAWNIFMITFECCGIVGPDDFNECHYFRADQTDDKWPQACCTRVVAEPSSELLDLARCRKREMEYINNEGCFPTIIQLLKKYITITETFAFGVLAFEVCAMIFACALCCHYNGD